MIRKKYNDVEWLEFELFQQFPNIVHGVFTRRGGTSSGAYESLNIGYDLGDDNNNVDANIALVKETLGVPAFVYAEQVHGIDIAVVEDAKNIPVADAIMTKTHGLALMIKHADCQAALFYDPINNAIAAVHSGWKGSVQNIYKSVITSMKKCYGSNPADIFVGISPSLGPNNAEFDNYKEELPEKFWEYSSGKNLFDFWEISKQQLLDEGVLADHIEIAKICTYDGIEDFFSFRRDNITGRNGTVMAIN
ncbi:MAG: peptidoglycan editing factor PgeF [Waddliaceae bacterium]|jgi:polyphenol oxidase|nr:peptidoglycan editing factor PgeF [Waddliaceae bacterium]MBT4445230.1 peptidoglycan editing factor PgeF [Waddliaceae bacterium]MBT7264671.1 peptidoglycan editing factor PgeF [Waddliaceae bacterium]